MKQILGIIVLIIIFAPVLAIIYYFSGGRKGGFSFGEKKLPFQKKKYFFSEAERKFYIVLKQIVDKNNLVLFSKIRLRDLFYAYGKNRFFENNRINQKHVDFLLCENSGFCPILGIELDDSSHLLEKRKRRDEFIDKVFTSVDLPLLRVRVAANYDINVLEQSILQKIKN